MRPAPLFMSLPGSKVPLAQNTAHTILVRANGVDLQYQSREILTLEPLQLAAITNLHGCMHTGHNLRQTLSATQVVEPKVAEHVVEERREVRFDTVNRDYGWRKRVGMVTCPRVSRC